MGDAANGAESMIVLTTHYTAMAHSKGVTKTSGTVRLETQRMNRRPPRDDRGMDCLYITRYLYNDLRPNFGPHTTGSVPLLVTVSTGWLGGVGGS